MDETLIADLIKAGLSAELVGRVANAIMSTVVDSRHVDRRAYQREWARKKRALTIASEANDAEASTVDKVSTTVDTSLTLLTSLSSKPIRGNRVSKKKSKELQLVTPRQKGSRLSSEVQILNEDREFAWTLGFDDAQVERMWAEFVDYWSAVPGHRGVKLSWSATWRNRVRAIAERKGNGAVKVHAAPRRGSRDDTRERLVLALDQLDDFAADGPPNGGETGAQVIGRIPKLKRP